MKRALQNPQSIFSLGDKEFKDYLHALIKNIKMYMELAQLNSNLIVWVRSIDSPLG